ncbi:origin recognition complex subunit 3 [Brevipalpus obovatus]|uniref:origin recognition complex subunit 3 n=1 Tax=Brevipalpus obovatus TaxID=246614 RepID=UPI003D9E4A13
MNRRQVDSSLSEEEDDDDQECLALSSSHAYEIIRAPKERRGKGKSRKDNNNPDIGEEFEASYESFRECQNFLDDIYRLISRKVFSKLYVDLAVFTRTSVMEYVNCDIPLLRYVQCALVTVSNVYDNPDLTSNFDEEVSELVSFILEVGPDDIDNISDLVHRLQGKYMDENNHDLSSELRCYSVFAEQYAADQAKDPSPCPEDNSIPPILIILTDFDRFESDLLTDLFQVIHQNLHNLPVILVCFQSSDVLPLELRLPSRATDCLEVKNYVCQVTRDDFFEMLEEVCFSPENPFFLGHQCINKLSSINERWDSSLAGAYRAIKFCLFEHFYDKPWTRFCCPTDKLPTYLTQLTDKDVKKLGAKFDPPCRDLKELRTLIKNNYNDSRNQFHLVVKELRCFHAFKQKLSQRSFPFISYTWTLFMKAEKFSSSQVFSKFCQSLTETEVEKIVKAIKEISTEEAANETQIIETLLKHCRKAPSLGFSPRKSVNSSLKDWYIELIKLLRESLDHLSCQMHEMKMLQEFCFDDVKKLSGFTSSFRENVHDILLDPAQDLECKCCDDLNITANSPDLSILYLIYCDNDRLINMNEYCESFKGFLANNLTVSPKKRKKKNTPVAKTDVNLLKNRFVHTLTDLEYMGLIKAHSRKQGYLERTFWLTLPTESAVDEKDHVNKSPKYKVGHSSTSLTPGRSTRRPSIEI